MASIRESRASTGAGTPWSSTSTRSAYVYSLSVNCLRCGMLIFVGICASHLPCDLIGLEQHMYPIGEELAKQFKAKPERAMWEQPWNSSEPDAWPKLMHYRWFSNPGENGCTHDSPMGHMPAYTKYLVSLAQSLPERHKSEHRLTYMSATFPQDELRKDVYDKKAKLEAVLADSM